MDSVLEFYRELCKDKMPVKISMQESCEKRRILLQNLRRYNKYTKKINIKLEDMLLKPWNHRGKQMTNEFMNRGDFNK